MLLVFIPVNVMMYLPNLLPFTPSFFKPSTVEPARDLISVVTTQETSASSEEELPVDTSTLFGNIAKPDSLEKRKVSSAKGFFDKCISPTCESVSVFTDTSMSKTATYSLGSTTVPFCVNKSIKGVNMTTYNIDFKIEDDLYTVIPFTKLSSVLNNYHAEDPIQYEFIGGNLNWISIYLDDCDVIK